MYLVCPLGAVGSKCLHQGAEGVAPLFKVPELVEGRAGRREQHDVPGLCGRAGGGHGIGKEFHEDPFVSFVEEAGTGPIMAPGMCFTIEPMVNAGEPTITTDEDNGWIVRTADGSDSAQWEVQLVDTERGYELLSW